MNIKNLIYLFILLISVDHNLAHSSYFKKNFLVSILQNKYSLGRILLVQNETYTKTIVVKGKGKSKEKAAMNAAQNALLMASPMYIKKRRVSLYKETSIDGNLIPEESIDSYRESSYGFNQGSILSFKVTKTSINNNVYSVVAIAKVKYGLNNKEFHPLFKPPEVLTKEMGVQKIFKIGSGLSEEKAIQDAIEQALIFLVGEKINVQTNLEDIVQITNFIDNELEKENFYTKETLDDLTSGYSEGFIESFKKLNSFEEDGFYKVEADIVVRIKNFSSFIDQKLNPIGIKVNVDK